MNSLLRTAYFFALVILSFLYSCQQSPDDTLPPVDPPAPPPGTTGADSSQLVKSISYVYYSDDGIAEDSATEFYSYDTVARKITLTWDVPDGPFGPGGKHELFYNSSHLLTAINCTFPAGYSPTGNDISSTNMSYDAAGILQTVFVKYMNGATLTKTYTKTTLPDGRYQVAWRDTASGSLIMGYKLRFNAQGQPQGKERHYYGYLTDPSPMVGTYDIDTLGYDAGGSLDFARARKIINDVPGEEKEYFRILARETKGDQLYKQRQLLLNGVVDFVAFDENYLAFGSVTTLNEIFYEAAQYCKYPIISVKDGTEAIDVKSDFDSKNRLVRLGGFFDDGIIIKTGIKIGYYK